MKESIGIEGIVTFDVYDEEGNHVRSITDKNLVTSAGKNYMMKQITGDSSVAGTIISDMAFGDGSTTASTSDISLVNETVRVSIDSILNEDNIGSFISTLDAGLSIGVVSEAGLYTNETSPSLVSRIVLSSPFTKQENESIIISWKLKIGSDNITQEPYIQSGYVQTGYV